MTPVAEALRAQARALNALAATLDNARPEPSPGADPIVDLRSSLPAGLRRHAYAAARTGQLVAHKHGKRWYAKQSTVDKWLASGEHESKPTAADPSRWLGKGAA